jgi:hypothetical protein
MTNKGKSIIEKCEKNNIPYIVFSAKDIFAIKALRAYMSCLFKYPSEVSEDYLDDISEILHSFAEFRHKYGCKIPD